MLITEDTNFHAFIMSKDVPVAEVCGRNVKPLRPDLVPLCFSRLGDINAWLRSRAIDSHRTHSRLLKRMLRMKETDDISTVLSVHGATITDCFWIKEAGSDLTWDAVRFQKNDFAELALHGDFAAFDLDPAPTPELTNIGSFEKCWKLIDGQWWMYKSGKELEVFSELFICQLCKAVGFPTADYELADGDIRTRDFTEGKVNFEPAANFMRDNDDYVDNYRAFQKIRLDIADQYVELLIMDAICLNMDRHTYNYGLLRDQDTGEILRLAPNFDNNIALLYNGYRPEGRVGNMLVRWVAELEKETGALSGYASRHPLPVITPEIIRQCCLATGIEVDIPYVQRYVMDGYQMVVPLLVSHQNEQQTNSAAQPPSHEPEDTDAWEPE